MTQVTAELTTMEKGRHAELIASMSLMANGWTVMESVSPAETFDLAIKRHDSKRVFYVQVKTGQARQEDRYGVEPYVVAKGAKNNGGVYTKFEIDYFIAVYDGKAYMFPNREITEYWCKVSELGIKWTELEMAL